MCECGCSDGIGEYRLPGPVGKVLTVAIYPGCDNCDAPAGADFRLYTAKEAKVYEAENLPMLEFHHGMAALPVMDPRALTEAITKHTGSDFAEWSTREVFDIMSDTVHASKMKSKQR